MALGLSATSQTALVACNYANIDVGFRATERNRAIVSFRPSNIAPGCLLLAAWGYWSYHVVRAISAAGRLGAYWADRGLFGKIAFVIWAWVAVCVALAVIAAVGAALFALVHIGVNAVLYTVRSTRGRKP